MSALLRRLVAGLLLAIGGGVFTSAVLAQQPGGSPAAPLSSQAAAEGWWNHAAHFLMQPGAAIAFLVAGCLLIYWDLLTPKTWDLTGSLGVVLVGLVFAAEVTVGDTGWVGVLLLLAGLAAVLMEIHIFPGYGSAIAGFVLMFAGMFLSLGGTHKPAFSLSVTTVLTIVTGIAFLTYLPKSPAWKRLSQQMQQQVAVATEGAVAAAIQHSRETAPVLSATLLGQKGVTLTDLRPSGLADVNGVHLSVVTEGDFLSVGASVVITDVEGDRVVVDPVPVTQTIASPVVAEMVTNSSRGA